MNKMGAINENRGSMEGGGVLTNRVGFHCTQTNTAEVSVSMVTRRILNFLYRPVSRSLVCAGFRGARSKSRERRGSERRKDEGDGWSDGLTVEGIEHSTESLEKNGPQMRTAGRQLADTSEKGEEIQRRPWRAKKDNSPVAFFTKSTLLVLPSTPNRQHVVLRNIKTWGQADGGKYLYFVSS